MIRRPPRSTLTYTLFPYTTLFRSYTNINVYLSRQHSDSHGAPCANTVLITPCECAPCCGSSACSKVISVGMRCVHPTNARTAPKDNEADQSVPSERRPRHPPQGNVRHCG